MDNQDNKQEKELEQAKELELERELVDTIARKLMKWTAEDKVIWKRLECVVPWIEYFSCSFGKFYIEFGDMTPDCRGAFMVEVNGHSIIHLNNFSRSLPANLTIDLYQKIVAQQKRQETGDSTKKVKNKSKK